MVETLQKGSSYESGKKPGVFEIKEKYTYKDLEKLQDAKINVIIPAYKSADTVGTVIDKIAEEKFPENAFLRIVVCANGTRDNTAEVAANALVKANSARPNISFICMSTEDVGEPNALNQMVNILKEEAPAGTHGDNIIIGINDDVIPSPGSITSLYVAMRKFPGLGAIGVPPKAIGYEKNAASKIAAYMQDGGGNFITGKMYAFRPSVIEEFPDVIAEDLYMSHKSLVDSEGFGILKDSASVVYFTVPSTVQGVIDESVMHWQGAMQFQRLFRNNTLLTPEKESFIKRLTKESEYDFTTRLGAALIRRGSKKIAAQKEKNAPSRNSIRDRVKTISISDTSASCSNK